MAIFKTHLPKYRFSWIDIAVFGLILVLLYSVLSLGASMDAPYSPDDQMDISLDPDMLPYYAGRSLMRMFIAFGASLIFTLIYGYVAAKSQTAEKVLIPLLDMLQSVPVLGFLSATIAAFMALFPNTLLGVELASIFAIFTGQAWNMTFSFYNSLTSIPKDLQEASHILQLNKWQQFIKLEVPYAMIGLVWNGMMSFGGGWFFLAASESISVLGQNIRLPGVGSYLATAIEAGDMSAIVYSIITMIIMIVLVDQVFWRPLVVWSQKFKMELTESSEVPSSWVYDLFRRSKTIELLCKILFIPIGKIFYWLFNQLAIASERTATTLNRYAKPNGLARLAKTLLIGWVLILLVGPAYEGYQLVSVMDKSRLFDIFTFGFYTFCRVMIAVGLGVLWTVPAGVMIGLNPKLAKVLQPLIQITASFPANMLFPFITILFLNYEINFEWGSIALMMLGTQWYILFNVIAGAMSIPNDLHEAGRIYKITNWRKWKVLILPGIFPYLLTGIITASGGAWNASIVSELVTWHDQELIATGLGSYISQVTEQGDWGGIVWGITMMCLFVVFINRFLWRRLYRLAEQKYRLD